MRLYGFIHEGKVREFGPYMTELGAANAFQWRYGYYPELPAISVRPYGDMFVSPQD